MGTENDGYGQQLGRKFKALWGGLAGGHDITDRSASYIINQSLIDDPEIAAFWCVRVKALEFDDALLIRDLGLDDNVLEREGNRSHAAMHAADAYRDVIIKRLHPEDYPEALSRRLFDSLFTLASVSKPYATDLETLAKFREQRDSVTTCLREIINKRLGLKSEKIPRSARVRLDQKAHLASEIRYTA